MSWPMKKFIDELCEPSWFYDDMVGRACGVFTTGSRPVEWCKSGRVSACGSVVATMP
ncbi:hypothetical protein LIX17_17755 [Mycobacterium avium subsp. hominissuis]